MMSNQVLPPTLELLVTIKVASMSGVFATSNENTHHACQKLIDDGLLEEIVGLASEPDRCYKLTEAGAKRTSMFYVTMSDDTETND